MRFSVYSDQEVERRRKLSVEVLAAIERAEWAQKYQEICDTQYWSNGPCCAGCDHWDSYAGLTGECQYAGIIPGDQVLASMGIQWSTLHNPSPGYPFTKARHCCSNFKDEFDWSTLPDDYLVKVGAKFSGVLQPKPQHTKEQR